MNLFNIFINNYSYCKLTKNITINRFVVLKSFTNSSQFCILEFRKFLKNQYIK